MGDTIETLLKQKIGLDVNSIGSRTIDRVIEQRQKDCHLPNRQAYLSHLNTSPQEMTRLIEAIVVPETWFFRDSEPFAYLRQYIKTEWQTQPDSGILRVLSAPCSTGEEPYSIAMTLLEAGLTVNQFRIDAVDISHQSLLKAQQAIYSKRSFRSHFPFNRHRYFKQVGQDWEVRSFVRQTAHFKHVNLVEPGALGARHYHVIFCRNLLIYLDRQSRTRLLQALDQVLSSCGLLFVGAVETGQLPASYYTLVDHPRAFAFRKQNALEVTWPKPDQPVLIPSIKPVTRSRPIVPPATAPAIPLPAMQSLSTLETAQQLANDGQLAKAAALCQSYLRVNPTQAQAHLLLGEIYQGMHQVDQAEHCFQKAIYLNPNDHRALLHLALLKELRGDQVGSDNLKRRLQRLQNSQPLLNSQV